MKNIRKLVQDTKGANMVEYIILVGVVAVIAIIGFKLFGGNVSEGVKAQGENIQKVGEKSNEVTNLD